MLDRFHPAVAGWFGRTFSAPTAPQLDAWPAIQDGRHTLIAAPTGSGKTLAAFLAAIDALVRQAARGGLQDLTQVIYVSPLKALSNDIQRNLQAPLEGITAELTKLGLPSGDIRAQVRTGDTPQSERAAMRRRPPHILVTTPESLYLLLTSESGRDMLSTVRSVIVDEIHAVVGSKRGAHLALSLERLDGLCARPLQRIGLSATQKPIEDVANFLVGTGAPLPTVCGVGRELRESMSLFAEPEKPEIHVAGCVIVDSGHVRKRDLALVLPAAPLEAVMSGEVWETVYDRLADLVKEHHTTLVFANTRRMVERVTRHLSERLGDADIAAHHGSLSKELRFDAEQRLKAGKLRVLVATASLELGIDIGDVDLVCQLGTPRAIATFLQRVGRANHAISGVPKGRLFPLSRDDLLECTALLDAVRRGELDRLIMPQQPLDVMAQQIVAEVAAREYGEDELFGFVRRAWPYRSLERKDFDAVVRMLSDGFSTRRGRQSAYLHRDAVNGRLRARKGARLTAVTCGGAIPDNADYQVVLEPSGTFIGTLNEDFAVESLAGDVFQLGNASYRIQRVEAGKVRVEDAKGQAPTIPFWLGEAPSRTAELSFAVSRLRADIENGLAENDLPTVIGRMVEERGVSRLAAEQIVEYLAVAKAALGSLPTQDTLILERFFDETGGMQLVVHAPFGARINRAFGLALRKRFCRSFNFELQAAATEDAIVLSLGETHSFPLEDVARYLHSHSVKEVLTQAVLDAPLFATRWRWNATISGAVKRYRGGQKTPPQLQRIAAEDLISVVFPDQLACAENLTGEREIPDHPLVKQTLQDCLYEAMDLDGLIGLLQAIESGEKKILARDLPQPSPLAQEILTARPYAFLDDAPLEERRTQAVAARRWMDPKDADEFGRLDPQAIAAVRAEAWPSVGSADELHDALISLGLLTEEEGEREHWRGYLDQLVRGRRAARLSGFWVAAEQIPQLRVLYPNAVIDPPTEAPAEYAHRQWTTEAATLELLRGRLQGVGPTTVTRLVDALRLTPPSVEQALIALEAEGFVLRGEFSARAGEVEWCERRLLARIHRYTIRTLRAEIEPVSSADFVRFLFDWQGVTREPRAQGAEALGGILEQLEGFEAPAMAWETDILTARLQDYDPAWLDMLCLSGRALWTRLTLPKATTSAPVKSTPIAVVTRQNWQLWQALTQADGPAATNANTTANDKANTNETAIQTAPDLEQSGLSHSAQAMVAYLRTHGASFFDELAAGTGILKAQAEDGLNELVASGLVSSDSFNGLRALLMPSDRKRRLAMSRQYTGQFGLENAGRWSLIRRYPVEMRAANIEQVAMILLRRYGVVFRKMLEREAGWLPPWYQLLRAYRRLEAQGLIRGGRFVDGFAGEQYALSEAVGALRAMRRQPPDGRFVSLSASDPLNLAGVLTPGALVPALASNRVLWRNGVPVATHVGGETQFLASLDPSAEWTARNTLLNPRTIAVTESPAAAN